MSVFLGVDHEVTDHAEQFLIALDESVQGCLESAVVYEIFRLLSVRIISLDELRLG